MLFFKKSVSDEKRICALCEYATIDGEELRCGRKRVSPTHSCRKFIYDPFKRKDKHLSFDKNDFTFEKIE